MYKSTRFYHAPTFPDDSDNRKIISGGRRVLEAPDHKSKKSGQAITNVEGLMKTLTTRYGEL